MKNLATSNELKIASGNFINQGLLLTDHCKQTGNSYEKDLFESPILNNNNIEKDTLLSLFLLAKTNIQNLSSITTILANKKISLSAYNHHTDYNLIDVAINHLKNNNVIITLSSRINGFEIILKLQAIGVKMSIHNNEQAGKLLQTLISNTNYHYRTEDKNKIFEVIQKFREAGNILKSETLEKILSASLKNYSTSTIIDTLIQKAITNGSDKILSNKIILFFLNNIDDKGNNFLLSLITSSHFDLFQKIIDQNDKIGININYKNFEGLRVIDSIKAIFNLSETVNTKNGILKLIALLRNIGSVEPNEPIQEGIIKLEPTLIPGTYNIAELEKDYKQLEYSKFSSIFKKVIKKISFLTDHTKTLYNWFSDIWNQNPPEQWTLDTNKIQGLFNKELSVFTEYQELDKSYHYSGFLEYILPKFLTKIHPNAQIDNDINGIREWQKPVKIGFERKVEEFFNELLDMDTDNAQNMISNLPSNEKLLFGDFKAIDFKLIKNFYDRGETKAENLLNSLKKTCQLNKNLESELYGLLSIVDDSYEQPINETRNSEYHPGYHPVDFA